MAGLFGSGSEYPRPEGPTLEMEELRPADVLLSRGTSEISSQIVAADGASYSHAALWAGPEHGVVESVLDGIHKGASPSGRDVYRFESSEQELSAEVAGRIVDAALEKVGGDYATAELHLLGTLFAMGWFPRRSLVRVGLDLLGGARADALERWLSGLGSRRSPVVCTELVSGAFYSASDTGAFALRILPRHARPKAPGEPLAASQVPGMLEPLAAALAVDPESEKVDALQSRCLELLGGSPQAAPEVSPAVGSVRKLLFGSIARDAFTDRRLGVVTPGDLQFSPSLRFRGRVA